MRDSQNSGGDLGGVMAVVKPHPVSVFIGCIPGIVMCWTMFRNVSAAGFLSLFDPAVSFVPGVRLFLIGFSIISLFVLWLGLRHIFDRAELCQEGLRFLGKPYRYDQIGPIAWSHNSNNGMTRFYDCTTLSFYQNGKLVKLRTRYLQDLSYEYHRVYATDPTGGAHAGVSTPQYSNSVNRARPR